MIIICSVINFTCGETPPTHHQRQTVIMRWCPVSWSQLSQHRISNHPHYHREKSALAVMRCINVSWSAETVYCRGLVRPLLPHYCCIVQCLVLGKHDPMIMGIVTTQLNYQEYLVTDGRRENCTLYFCFSKKQQNIYCPSHFATHKNYFQWFSTTTF